MYFLIEIELQEKLQYHWQLCVSKYWKLQCHQLTIQNVGIETSIGDH